MGGHHGSWTVLGVVALCAIFGAVSGVKMFVPQKISFCQKDTDLMKVEMREHQGDGGKRLYSGYVFTPVPIDEKFQVVLKVHFPSGDTYSADPMVLKVPDPCKTMKSTTPGMLKGLAAIFNNKDPSCPVPKGNYTFSNSPMELPVNFPLLRKGLYKVHVEAFQESKTAACADLIMKLVDKKN